MPFLREKFSNHLLCIFRNLTWLECQYILEPETIFLAIVSTAISIILSKKNYKHVWNSFLRKWTCEWRRPPRIRMDFRIHSRELFLDWGCRSIRRLVHSVFSRWRSTRSGDEHEDGFRGSQFWEESLKINNNFEKNRIIERTVRITKH